MPKENSCRRNDDLAFLRSALYDDLVDANRALYCKDGLGLQGIGGGGHLHGRMHRQTPLLLTMTAREGPVPSPLVALDEAVLLGTAGRTH